MSFEFDFLVIGSGIAGLSSALKLAKHGTVAIVTKKEKAEANTTYAQGGIASVFHPKDSYEQHIKDTLEASAGLCHMDAVRMVVERGPTLVRELATLGVDFTRTPEGFFDLGREGGHHHKRIVHVKDHTGRDVELALLNAVKHKANITLLENHVAIDLITEHHIFIPTQARGSSLNCWGAYVLDSGKSRVKRFTAKATILATGGCGQVYLHTTNPLIATGDGVAMCFRAGAAIANMEFMQFHPTTLYHSDADSFLITEALRGFGGRLINKRGELFMDKQHDLASLAPRDVVARAIDAEMKKSGERCVFLDVTHKPADEIINRFPQIYQKCKHYKIDITSEPIPVVPAAHYSCGGVVTNLRGETQITGLFACGEVSCTGVHGANRLASNSLLEALVYAETCARSAQHFLKSGNFTFPPVPYWDDQGTFNSEEWVLISHDLLEIKNLMWDYVGIVRSNLRLERALSRIRLIRHEIENFYRRTTVTPGIIELRNLATVAQLIIQAALLRKESRGLHYTTDYPKSDDDYLKDTVIQQQIM
ncbi:L-aspartate oxidase [candidate division KSB1 bacterium]|nr:L-aspartate oxidase [candidate division KSB1 bacterium]RQW06735.1 MAG: L-aspartate oxidase [candidate division KSB1 bacterium]